MKIALIAGHDSFGKQGAVAGGQSENKFWSEFIEDLLPLVLNGPHDIKVFKRPEQRPIGYSKAMRQLHAKIDAWGADLDIEMHFNAATAKAQGHEVLYYNKSVKGKMYAEWLNKLFTKYLTNSDRGAKGVSSKDRGGYGLKVGKSASILTEAFFGTREIADYKRGGKFREALLKAYTEFLFGL
jgi:hypothetical protein